MNGWAKGIIIAAHGMLLAGAIFGIINLAREVTAIASTMDGVVQTMDRMDTRHDNDINKIDGRVRDLETRAWDR